MRIASFGFRSLPPTKGSAGADKFALELLPRLVEKGCSVVAYNRLYPGQKKGEENYKGVRIVYFRTVSKAGFDSLIHSFKVTLHIIFSNSADIIHIQGNNAIFGLILKIFGKKVILSIDGVEWNRDKWSPIMKKFVLANAHLAVLSSRRIAIDNVFTKKMFEERFKRSFDFISFGSEVHFKNDTDILDRLGLKKHEYFLFVGRFIPDKGIHYLIEAFKKFSTNKKLVLVGGAPNQNEYETNIKSESNERILFPGFIYGDDTLTLMKNAFTYIQPSDLEGLSPVVLTVMGLGTPLICSDIQENVYLAEQNAILFEKSNVDSLRDGLIKAEENRRWHLSQAKEAQLRITKQYSWNGITDQYLELFKS